MKAIVFRLTDFREAAEAKPFQPRKSRWAKWRFSLSSWKEMRAIVFRLSDFPEVAEAKPFQPLF